jgi:hypothetical protein
MSRDCPGCARRGAPEPRAWLCPACAMSYAAQVPNLAVTDVVAVALGGAGQARRPSVGGAGQRDVSHMRCGRLEDDHTSSQPLRYRTPDHHLSRVHQRHTGPTRIAAALRDTHHRRREQRYYACPHCGHWHLSSRPDRPLTSRQRRNRRRALAWLARSRPTIP